VARLSFGSPGNSGEGSTDLEEEVGIVAEAVGDAFDDLDLVVNPFQQARVQGVPAVGRLHEMKEQDKKEDLARARVASA
jgi:hypothetical protein